MERRVLKAAAILTLVLTAIWPQTAKPAEEPFPERPVKIILPFSPGGGSDRELRMVQPILEKKLGASVVIENRAGGGTVIANTILQRAPADGYVLLYTNWDSLVLTTITGSPGYTMDDFEALAVQLIDPTIILVPRASPYNCLADFVQAAKQNPGKIAVGATTASAQQLLVLAIRDQLKLDIRVVGYPGGGPARAAMLGGHVDAAIAEVQSGYYLRDQTKAIAIFADRTYSQWPEARPINEQLKAYGTNIANVSRYGVYMVRVGLRAEYPERFSKLQSALIEAGKDPEYREAAKKAGIESLLVWQPGDSYREDFREQRQFFERTKHLWAR